MQLHMHTCMHTHFQRQHSLLPYVLLGKPFLRNVHASYTNFFTGDKQILNEMSTQLAQTKFTYLKSHKYLANRFKPQLFCCSGYQWASTCMHAHIRMHMHTHMHAHKHTQNQPIV